MSTLIVEVVRVDAVNKHPNADKLELVTIKGWQTVEGIGKCKVGDSFVYIPPDSVLPLELSDKHGVTVHLSKQKVRPVKLRGEMSFGFLIPNEENLPIGTDVCEKLGITKWEPPERVCGGQCERPDPLFFKYTDIENFRNFNNILDLGTEIVVTEKIHGTNSRIGLVFDTENPEGIFMIGSHNTRKRLGTESLYERVLTDNVKDMLRDIASGLKVKSVILYSEIYGQRVQDLNYGLTGQDWMAFDISVDGSYLDYDDFQKYCEKYKIKTVPLLWRGPYMPKTILDLYKGKTTLIDNGQIREGIVFKPTKEMNHRKVGRVIFKMINDDYLLRKGGSENH